MPKILTLFLFFCLVKISPAQIRIYSNEFLSTGAGAEAMALSDAVTASSDNVYSAYYNPAGLIGQKSKYEIAAMHSEYFAGTIKYDYLAASYKINDSSVFAGTMIRFGTDNIPNTLNLIDENGNTDYSRISYFSAADWAFILSYAKKSNIPGLSYGLNTKIIYRNLGEFANAFGFGFDLGIKYIKNKWKFGARLQDATSTFNAWFYNTESLEKVFAETGNEIPKNGIEITMPELFAGAARKFKISKKLSMRTEIDFDMSFDGKKYALLSSKIISVAPSAGTEFNYKNIVFLRFGIGNIAKVPDFDKKTLIFKPGTGIGLKIFNLRLDYALTDTSGFSDSFYSNIFSLSYTFDNIKINKK